MASLAEVVAYQSNLSNLITLTLADLLAFWRSLDTEDAAGSAEAVREFLPDLVDTYLPLSAEVGAAFYDEVRDQSGVGGAFVATPADEPNPARMQSMVGWAVAPLFRRDVVTESAAPDPKLALSRLSGGTQREVAEGARQTIVENVEKDTAKPRFARHASSNACAFCRLVATRGPVYRSAASAGDGHKYHNNCVVPGTLVSGPDTHTGYRRHYEGELITLVTASGNELSITPKHPVLTDRGWVPAGLLNVGDQLVSAVRRDRNVVSGPDVDHVPSRIEDVVRALGMVRSATRLRVPGSTEEFHGDGFASEVDVVAVHDLLRSELHSSLPQPVAKLDLHRATPERPVGRFAGSGVREQEMFRVGTLSSADGLMGVRSKALAFLGSHGLHSDLTSLARSSDRYPGLLEPAGDHVSAHPVMARHRQDTDAFSVKTGQIRRGGQSLGRDVSVPRKFDPPAFDGNSKTLRVFAELGADLRERLSGSVHLDRLVDKRVSDYQGDVLNLETSEGWYSTNGITVSNCHCVVVPVWKDDYEPAPYVAGWESAYIQARRDGAADTTAILAHMRQSLGAA